MKTALLVEHAGHSVAAEHIRKVLLTNPTSLAIVGPGTYNDVEQLVTEYIPDLKDVGKSVDEQLNEIAKLQKDTVDGRVMLCFSDDPGDILLAEDNTFETPGMQPYGLLSDKSGTHLMVALSGEFGKFKDAESKQPAEYHLVQRKIIPRINSLVKLMGGADLEKIVAFLKDDESFRADLLELAEGDNAVFCFLSSSEDMFTINKGTNPIEEHPWGWSTFTERAAAKAAEPAKEEGIVAAAGRRFGFRSKPKAEETPAKVEPPPLEKPKVEPKKDDNVVTKPVDDKPVVTKIGKPYYKNVTGKWCIKCPEHLSNKNDVRGFYEQWGGFKPDRFRDKPEVEVRLTEFQMLEKCQQSAGAAPNVNSNKPKITVTSEKVPFTGAKDAEGATIPIFPSKLRDEMLKDAIVLKAVDSNSTAITPEQVDEMNKRYAAFNTQTGGKFVLADFAKMSFDDMKQFRAKFPDIADVAFFNFVCAYVKSHKMEAKKPEVEAPPAEVKATGTDGAKPRFGFQKKK